MKTIPRLFSLITAIFLLLSAAACQPKPAPSLSGQAGQTGNQPASPLAQAETATTTTRSSQVQALLPDPSVGLSTLKNYQAVLTREIKGTVDGKPYQRQTRVEFRQDAAGNEEIKQHLIGSGEVPLDRHFILQSGAVYELNETGENCSGRALDPDSEDLYAQPGFLLIPVVQAELAGSETMNTLPAKHYRFDGSGLQVEKTDSAIHGELWLAEDSGQVVRYRLEVAAPANPTGKGVEVAQSWQYDLTPTSSQDAIRLPANCLPVMVDIPVMPDAAGVQRNSGVTSFTTASSAKDVFVFYQQKLAAQGWRVINQSLPDPLKFPYPINAEKEKQNLTIQLDEGENGGLDVVISIYDLGSLDAFAQVTPQVAPTPQATIDPSATGLPEDIPLYPGSYDLKKLPNGALVFSANGRLNSVSKYYYDRMDASGWLILTTQSLADTETVTWVKEKRQVMFVAKQKDSAVQIMILQVSIPK